MKATGIVRRIDDLGRVVIPKEIRRTMRIREGDPLEIYTDAEGEVIFKKYSPIGELSEFAGQYAEVLFKTAGAPVLVCDRDHVVAVSGMPKKEVLERRISPALEEMNEQRRPYVYERGQSRRFQPIEGVERCASVQYPIVASGDVCGSIMFLGAEEDQEPTEAEEKLIQTAAVFLGKQMEQ